jgi:hypothetical protein
MKPAPLSLALLLVAAPLVAQESPIARVDLLPDTLRIEAGETAPLELRAYDVTGRVVPHGQVAWFSGWENTRIDDQGNLQGLNPGTTMAGAQIVGLQDSAGNAISDRVVVIVDPAPPADVRVALPEGAQPAGSFLSLEPVAVDRLGNELWDVPVALESSTPEIVRISGSELALLRPGRGVVRAIAGRTAKEIVVEVGPAPDGTLMLSPERSTTRTGEAVGLTIRAGDRPIEYPRWWVTPGGADVYADNYFVAEQPGTYEIAAEVGDRMARTTIVVTQRPREGGWTKVGQIASPARTSDLWVFEGRDGRDYAYFGTFAAQMRAYDVTDPTNPVFTDSIVVDGRRVNDVKVNDDASVAVITLENDPGRHNGIVTLDITDPAHPRVLAHFFEGLTGGIHNTYIVGDLVYAVNDGTRDVHILDISDPLNPRQVGRWGLDTERKALHDIWIADGMAYLSYWDDGLVVLDIGKGIAGGTPTEPKFVSRINYPNGNTHVAWPWKNYVFLGDEIFPSRYSPDAPSDPRGFMHVIDMSDPFHPREVGKYEVPEGGTHNFWVHDDVLYIGYYQRGLRAIDLSDGPLRGDLYRQGREIDYFLTETSDPERAASPTSVNRTNVWGAMWHKGYIYAIDTNSGLWIMKLERPGPEDIARK